MIKIIVSTVTGAAEERPVSQHQQMNQVWLLLCCGRWPNDRLILHMAAKLLFTLTSFAGHHYHSTTCTVVVTAPWWQSHKLIPLCTITMRHHNWTELIYSFISKTHTWDESTLGTKYKQTDMENGPWNSSKRSIDGPRKLTTAQQLQLWLFSSPPDTATTAAVWIEADTEPQLAAFRYLKALYGKIHHHRWLLQQTNNSLWISIWRSPHCTNSTLR